MIKVNQIKNNQFEITDYEAHTRTFQSYNSIIAQYENGELTLDANYWKYSKTTSKYLREFMNDDTLLDELKKANKKIEFENGKEYNINGIDIKFNNLN